MLKKYLICFIFIIIGLGLIIAGISIKNRNSVKIENAVETTATITNITHDKEIVIVQFNVKGENFKGRYNVYSSSLKIGQKVSIYYDPMNPNNFVSKNTEFLHYFFILIGGFSTIMGGGLFYNKYKNF